MVRKLKRGRPQAAIGFKWFKETYMHPLLVSPAGPSLKMRVVQVPAPR